MSNIYVTGDTHGDVYHRCLDFQCFNPCKDDYLIICGDFGLIWRNKENLTEYEKIAHKEYPSTENQQILKINSLPYKVLFVDGNHSNHNRLDNDYPIVDFCGGKAHKISDNIYHLMRGEMFDIAGKKIFTFGGARSHDIWNLVDPHSDNYWDIVDSIDNKNEFYRELGISWWEEEVPTEEEYRHGYETLEKHNWQCDYIITHEAPTSDFHTYNIKDSSIHPLQVYLEFIKRATAFEHWYYGHYHVNRTTTDKCTCNYSRILNVDDGVTICDMQEKLIEPFTEEQLDSIIEVSALERQQIRDKILR